MVRRFVRWHGLHRNKIQLYLPFQTKWVTCQVYPPYRNKFQISIESCFFFVRACHRQEETLVSNESLSFAHSVINKSRSTSRTLRGKLSNLKVLKNRRQKTSKQRRCSFEGSRVLPGTCGPEPWKPVSANETRRPRRAALVVAIFLMFCNDQPISKFIMKYRRARQVF